MGGTPKRLRNIARRCPTSDQSRPPIRPPSLIGPTHNDISGQPGCDTATSAPCLVGVYGYLGYPTAWMADRLGLDPAAHGAFVSGAGEIFSQISHWEFIQSNIQ
jgi:hypothetical protein